MRHSLTVVALVVLVLIQPGSSFAEDPPLTSAPVLGLIEAFNDHDAGRMAGWVTEDFELYYVTDGKAELATTGPEQLQGEMTSYFRALPTVQSSIAVYELEGDRIKRVWYFPAEGS